MKTVKLVTLCSIALLSSCDQPDESLSDSCAIDNQCVYDKLRIKSTVACKMAIRDVLKEKYAYKFEFEDSISDIFLKSVQIEDGFFRFSGDKLRLQNQFGAFKSAKYECDVTAESLSHNYSVLNIEIFP